MPHEGIAALEVPRARSEALAQVVATFRRWLHLPDPSPLYAVLATVAANRMPGDPVWLLTVGPPGGGKTELLVPLTSLHDVYPAATLTEAALLSGTPKRDKAKDAQGGLLRKIGDFGIVLCKDFGSVLSMHRDARAGVLAALREVYDGSWTRHVGTDGGRTLHWDGKVGLLAGCTPSIDNHHAVMGSMGERFVLYRLPPVDANAQAGRALAHAGREIDMRAELAGAVVDLFAHLDLDRPPPFSEMESARLVELATLAVRCRSAVDRDSYSREVQLIPEAEAPARLTLVLSRILAGLTAIGVDHDLAWSVITKIALDSMPAIRRAGLDTLLAADRPLDTTTIAERLGYPTTTTRRALEDLNAHGVIDLKPQGSGKAHLWNVSTWTRERWAATVPETSGSVNGHHPTVPETSDPLLYLPLRIDDDFSGKVPPPDDRDDTGDPEDTEVEVET